MLRCFACTTEAAAQSYWKLRKQTKCKNLLVNIEIVVKQKEDRIFNCFFAKQCSMTNNCSELPFNLFKKTDNPISTVTFSGGCNPVNWLSQSRWNLTIEYLNLNFVPTPKLTLLHSFHFMRKRLLFLALGSFLFRECVRVQAFSIPIFCSSISLRI